MKKTIIMSLVGAALTVAANAAVTVTFKQVGTSVVAEYKGSLDLSEFNWNDASLKDLHSMREDGFWSVGSPTQTIFIDKSADSFFLNGQDLGVADSQSGTSFGYDNTQKFYFSAADIVGTVLNVDGSMTWNNKNLAAHMPVEGVVFNVWNSAGDQAQTITQVVSVPEPSSAALLGLGAFALLIRRKK